MRQRAESGIHPFGWVLLRHIAVYRRSRREWPVSSAKCSGLLPVGYDDLTPA